MKQKLLKMMLLLCALVVGSGSVWATDLTTSDFVLPSPQFSENFNSLSATSGTGNGSSITLTSQTAFGIFDKITCGKDANTWAIESNATFDSNVLSLSTVGTKNVIASITGKTFGTKGAFSIKVLKTDKSMFGLYAADDANAYAKANSSVYIQNTSGALSINSGSGWVSIGTYTSDIIELLVVYNNTNSDDTYGDGITLASKKAHVYVNGTCVMTGANPTAFTIPGASLTAFRVLPQAASGNNCTVDDVNFYNSLPTAPAVDLSTFEFANTTPSVTLSKVSSTYDASYTQTVSVAPAAYDGTITYSLDEENSTFDVENDAYIDEETGEITISTASNLASAKTIVVKASATATAKYNKPSDATYTLTVNPAPAGVGTPYFSQSAGSYYYGTSFTISCANSDKIYYTTDGTDPSKTNGTLYSGEISIISTVTVKAIGYDGEDSGDIGSVTYTLKAPEVPTFSFSAGSVTEGTDVELEMGDGGTKVVYTTDGSTPTASSTTYSSAITINYPTTIKAATVDAGDNLSSIVTNAYTIVVTKAVTLWSENFNGLSENDTPTEPTNDSYTDVTYACANGAGSSAGNTKVMNANVAEGAGSPELMVGKKGTGTGAAGGTFTITVPLDNIEGTLTLKYKQNANGLKATMTAGLLTNNQTESSKAEQTLTLTNVTKSHTSLTIVFQATTTSNVRLDDIVLTYDKQFDTEPVKVTDAGYATYVSTNPLDFTGKSIKAYIAKGKADYSGVNFTQVNKVPANTGVLLYKDGGTTENIPIFDGTGADATTGNLFVKGTGAPVASVDGNLHNYILNNGASGIGFYKAAGQTVAANRAYIQIDQTASYSIKGFIALPGSDETAVEAVKADAENGVIFNLAGQRIQKLQRGINIVNGRKVVVK